MIDRPTLRELKRDVEQLGEDDPTADLEVTITRKLVIERERAEREGRTILGVADTPGDVEHVRVDPYELTSEEKIVLDKEFDVEPDTVIKDSDR